jgi:hypothetical protein
MPVRVFRPQSPKTKSQVLPGGVRRAIHVFVPRLQERQKTGWVANTGDPVMAVRSSLYGYAKMRLYRRVEWDGPTELVEMVEPLPGTGGRGVAIVFTTAPLTVYWDDKPPATIDTDANQPAVRKPEKSLSA